MTEPTDMDFLRLLGTCIIYLWSLYNRRAMDTSDSIQRVELATLGACYLRLYLLFLECHHYPLSHGFCQGTPRAV